MPKAHAYGCRRDTPDQRDHLFAAAPEVIGALPKKVNLRDQLAFKPFNQLDLGSCTGQAIAAMVGHVRKKEGKPLFVPSRLGIYYCERDLEGTIDSDAGAEIRDGLKVLNTVGVSSEDDWAYDIAKFAQRPTDQYFENAKHHLGIKYKRVKQDPTQFKSCFAAGYGLVGGISVYDSFESDEVAKTGRVPMPSLTEDMLGGHALFFIGFDDVGFNNSESVYSEPVYIGINSWGEDWGDHGFFTIPQAYLHNKNLSMDFWTLRLQN